VFDDRAGVGRRDARRRLSAAGDPEGGDAWWVTVVADQVVTVDSLADARAELEAIARRHEGEYDGRGAPADP
jgi:hypothetical protein